MKAGGEQVVAALQTVAAPFQLPWEQRPAASPADDQLMRIVVC